MYAILTTNLTFLFLTHEVVRLPVSRCTLNPIELAWAQVKGHIETNAKRFNLVEVEKLAWVGFSIVTANRWKKLITHVQRSLKTITGLVMPCMISMFAVL